MTQNLYPNNRIDDGGTLKPPAMFKFMSVFLVLGCLFTYYIAFFKSPVKPPENYSDVLSLIGAFILWPLVALVWVSWSFSKVIYSHSGIEVYSGWGTKRFVKWDSIISVQNYRRFGARRFNLVDNNKKRISIDTTTETFLDFLSYAEQHLPSEVEK